MDPDGGRRGGPDPRDRPGIRRGFRGTEENAKTKICMRWLAGNCTYADRCNFAHGEEELRQLPPRSPNGGRGRGRGRGGYSDPGMMGYREGPGPQYGGRGQGGYGGRGMRPYENGGGMGGGGGMGPGMGGGGGMGGPRAQRERDAWIASGKPRHGPEGWTQYETPDTGEKYYHNQQTNVTQWERPECWVGE